MPKHLKIIIAVFIIAVSIVFIKNTIVVPSIELHNKTTELKNNYQQLSEQQITDYDGYYLAFQDKFEMSEINKETFLLTTEIIMSNRRDGENVAWKWAHENQNIDFQTFSSFYRSLMSFIEERYKANMAIERDKQNIVRQHNIILETFPNNVYNKVLRVKPLYYKKGYISKEVQNKFK